MKYFFITLLFLGCTEIISIRNEHPTQLVGKWMRKTDNVNTFLEFQGSGHYLYQRYIPPNQKIYEEKGIWVVSYLDDSNDKILNGSEEKHLKLHVTKSSTVENIGKITYVKYDYWEQQIGLLTIHLDDNHKLYLQEDTTTTWEE